MSTIYAKGYSNNTDILADFIIKLCFCEEIPEHRWKLEFPKIKDFEGEIDDEKVVDDEDIDDEELDEEWDWWENEEDEDEEYIPTWNFDSFDDATKKKFLKAVKLLILQKRQATISTTYTPENKWITKTETITNYQIYGEYIKIIPKYSISPNTRVEITITEDKSPLYQNQDAKKDFGELSLFEFYVEYDSGSIENPTSSIVLNIGEFNTANSFSFTVRYQTPNEESYKWYVSLTYPKTSLTRKILPQTTSDTINQSYIAWQFGKYIDSKGFIRPHKGASSPVFANFFHNPLSTNEDSFVYNPITYYMTWDKRGCAFMFCEDPTMYNNMHGFSFFGALENFSKADLNDYEGNFGSFGNRLLEESIQTIRIPQLGAETIEISGQKYTLKFNLRSYFGKVEIQTIPSILMFLDCQLPLTPESICDLVGEPSELPQLYKMISYDSLKFDDTVSSDAGNIRTQYLDFYDTNFDLIDIEEFKFTDDEIELYREDSTNILIPLIVDNAGIVTITPTFSISNSNTQIIVTPTPSASAPTNLRIDPNSYLGDTTITINATLKGKSVIHNTITPLPSVSTTVKIITWEYGTNASNIDNTTYDEDLKAYEYDITFNFNDLQGNISDRTDYDIVLEVYTDSKLANQLTSIAGNVLSHTDINDRNLTDFYVKTVQSRSTTSWIRENAYKISFSGGKNRPTCSLANLKDYPKIV